MSLIGYHASHEQFSPAELATFIRVAEKANFGAVMSSDHLAPWSVRQGNSGMAWTWLGAAMQASTLRFGSLAIPTDGRYHPAIVAQAAATLCDLFPGRFRWIAAGSGEALNERPLGKGWPDKQERNLRLLEGVTMIRSLWRGETVSSRSFIKAENLKLWSLPTTLPSIYGAALTTHTAKWMGGWADGLITVRKSPDHTLEIIEAFREGGGHGKPIVLQFQLSWAASTRQEAVEDGWDQWRSCSLDPEQLANLATPQQFDNATAAVTVEEFDSDLCASANAADHIGWIRLYQEMGFSEIYLHNRGRNQLEFIEFFGREVLPAFDE
jgi:coenzyme F420-dependent glucose-6-phosphate dehydrogenase